MTSGKDSFPPDSEKKFGIVPPILSSSTGDTAIPSVPIDSAELRSQMAGFSASLAGSAETQPSWFAWRQLLAVVLLVAVADFTLFQGGAGFGGWAAWCLASAAVVSLGVTTIRLNNRKWWVLICCLAITSLKLVWQGNWGLAGISIVQWAMWIMLLHGLSLEWNNVGRFLIGWIPNGVLAVPAALLTTAGMASGVSRARWIDYGIPVFVTAVFAIIFLMANPVATENFVQWIKSHLEICVQWLETASVGQFLFWVLVSLLGLGALSPRILDWCQQRLGQSPLSEGDLAQSNALDKGIESRFYRPALHTLLSVVVLFSIYLITEFQSMWFREFPKGFHYSGYAHQGAAWLTLALAFATLVLSLIFRGSLLNDPRANRLVRLAKLWSILNLLLAICVYNRLYVYVQFNGMTRMRIVALLGITCVVVGFLLVVGKIQARKTFGWLIRKQIATLASFIYLLALLPVDYLAYRYNCRKILAGKEAPSVQITEHPLSPSAYLAILPLLECPDPVIRDGVAAMLADTQQVDERRSQLQATLGGKWQEFQVAESKLHAVLSSTHAEQLEPFLTDPKLRKRTIQMFREKVFVWY